VGPWAGFVAIGTAGVVLCLAGLVLQQRRRRIGTTTGAGATDPAN
jgi:hypothetical protein